MSFLSEYEKIISRAEFRTLTGMSRTTEWKALNKGLLPDIVKLDNRILGYSLSSYMDWIAKNTFSCKSN
ncbi:helix-turn-helix transcriptional regulator [Vibrio olivae]|uniref:Helix-turn-helix transcriptional regulator n=1 Tax=Vibrio olivae TaxID=1243002 RepID=A0ABV5HQB1_9VIBR